MAPNIASTPPICRGWRAGWRRTAGSTIPARCACAPKDWPEWYFLPFYAILRAIPDKLGGVLAMFGAIAVLFVLPWLDTSRVRSATFRPIYKWFVFVLVIDFAVLGACGAKPPEGFWVRCPRSPRPTTSFTSWFCCRSWQDRAALAVPASIADSVLIKKAV